MKTENETKKYTENVKIIIEKFIRLFSFSEVDILICPNIACNSRHGTGEQKNRTNKMEKRTSWIFSRLNTLISILFSYYKEYKIIRSTFNNSFEETSSNSLSTSFIPYTAAGSSLSLM